MIEDNFSNNSWTDIYSSQKHFLVSFAYQITGSLMDAEDIVQETILDCFKTEFGKIRNHRAWMIKICSNKAIDFVKSAQNLRNQYFGIWLPDLIPDNLIYFNNPLDPISEIELSESLTISFLVLLQNLNPIERVIFLLKDVFGFSFAEISEIVEKKQESCRKIAERARRAVKKSDMKAIVKTSESDSVIREIFYAAKFGDKVKIRRLLSENSEFSSDTGGKVKTVDFPSSRDNISNFFASLKDSPIFNSSEFEIKFIKVNFRPGAIVIKKNDRDSAEIETIMSFDIFENKISNIYVQRNPDKLVCLNRFNFSV